MLGFFFVLRSKFHRALKLNKLQDLYNSSRGVKLSVILFSFFFWLHCTFSVIDAVFAITQLGDKLTLQRLDYAIFTLSWQIINLLTEILCFYFFYLHYKQVKTVKAYIQEALVTNKEEWKVKKLMQGSRLANSGRLKHDASTMEVKNLRVSCRNSEEIKGNKKGKISESDPTLHAFTSHLLMTTNEPWHQLD